MKVRLNKYLTLCGLGSRRKVEDFITSGLIKINGEVVRELGSVIDTETDKVFFKDSELVASEKKYYLILNKPEGFVTTLSDEKGRPTVMDLIPEKSSAVG
jgi:16S rRNA U516 pseudouridylate synthase RsuA-like enzyme